MVSIDKKVKMVGIDKYIIRHTARHTFAIQALSNGIDIRTVGTWLGHASIRATEIYCKATIPHLANTAVRMDEFMK